MVSVSAAIAAGAETRVSAIVIFVRRSKRFRPAVVLPTRSAISGLRMSDPMTRSRSFNKAAEPLMRTLLEAERMDSG